MSGDVLLVTGEAAEDLAPLREALYGEGYTLYIASGVEGAIQQARQRPPIAMIIDADFQPDAPGPALCRWLRTDPATIAVTILATVRDGQERLAALEAGADEFLTPPLDWLEVRTRLRSLQAGLRRMPSLEDFLAFTPDLALGANPVDILGTADMLSHDLKSPIGIVASSLELLKEYAQERASQGYPLGEREVSLFNGALLACRRLTFLINDMIDLAKVEVDAYPLHLEPLDVAALVREVVDENAAAIARKGIAVTVEAPEKLPPAFGDKEMFKRVCNALVDNTLKFTIGTGCANLKISTENGHLLVRLIDDGRPIAPEYDDVIFERAVQWEARQNGSRTSVALGLPFARTVMRRMNGDLVAFSSRTDKTTVFSLRLPLANHAPAR